VNSIANHFKIYCICESRIKIETFDWWIKTSENYPESTIYSHQVIAESFLQIDKKSTNQVNTQRSESNPIRLNVAIVQIRRNCKEGVNRNQRN
jgi:hypothetical protein